MTDKYRLDSNKMLWHMDRVQAWQRGEIIAPIHIDAGLSKTCNIRCEYCFGRLQGNKYKEKAPPPFPREALLRYVREAGECGVRSIGFIGEAEPTMNPALSEAIVAAHEAGIDVALGTNGILLNDIPLTNLRWLRFNLSAASKESYKLIHGADKFEKVLTNVREMVRLRGEWSKTTIGLQMVLTPNNIDQAVPLAKLGKELGVDYLVIKQCSDSKEQAESSHTEMFNSGEFNEGTGILLLAEAESTDTYKVIAKWDKIHNCGRRRYDKHRSTPFILYSSGDGLLYPCSGFFEGKYKESMCMGDLKENGFREILESDRYWDIVKQMEQKDISGCYTTCRSHSINEFLHDYVNPPEHLNFV